MNVLLKVFTEDDLLDLINDNMFEDDDIQQILRNQNIVVELVKLRDTPNLQPEQLIEKLITLTDGLILPNKNAQRSRT